MKNLKLFYSLVFSFFFFTSQGQFDCSFLAIGGDINIKRPTGELKDNGLTHLYGANVELFYLGLRTNNLIIAPGVRYEGGTTRFKYGNTFDLEGPEGGTATERLSVEYAGVSAVMRFIWTKNDKILPYGEFYLGLRGYAGYERLRADQDFVEFENTKDKISSGGGKLGGLGIGVLYKLNSNTYLNLKVSKEWQEEINHLNLANPNYYSLTPVTTSKSSNLGFNIGFLVDLFPCEKKKQKRSTTRNYRPKRNFFVPKRTEKRAIKKKSVIKT